MGPISASRFDSTEGGGSEISPAIMSVNAEPEAAPPPPPPHRPKSRLIVRLGALLVAHSFVVSVICCTAGFAALVLLPFMAKNTYISENALIPGSATPIFSGQDATDASKLMKDITKIKATKESEHGLHGLLARYIASVGAEVYFHKFPFRDDQLHPLQFFSCNINLERQAKVNYTSLGINTIGIVRASRGDGKESIVLVTPYNPQNVQVSEVMSIGLGFSIFSLLSRVDWLAKDIVWLVADSRFGEYMAVSEWLKDYHNPDFVSEFGNSGIEMFLQESVLHGNYILNGRNLNRFRRAGTMAAALVLKVVNRRERGPRDTLTIRAEASNGQMPNLDLINTVHYLAVHRQGLHVKIGSLVSLLNSGLLRFIGEILQNVGKLAERLNPKWKFTVSSSDYVDGTAVLASSILHQALGVPTGSHGAFRDYQVDAITLELAPRDYPNNENAQSAFILRGGRLIEGVIRSINNLLEKFHQSFFLYILSAPNKFVSVGVYMIGFLFLSAPLPVVASSLLSENTEPVNGGRRWLLAAKKVLSIHLWSLFIAVVPSVISKFTSWSSIPSFLLWAAISIFLLPVTGSALGSPYAPPSSGGWKSLKAVTIVAASIGLGLMSIINFSTAQIGSLLLVPMCLTIRPLKQEMGKFDIRVRGILVSLFNGALLVAAFPPSTGFLIGGGFSEGFRGVGVLWDWMVLLWRWRSATYLYLVLVHLPCWVLCVHIFLHP